MAAQSLRQKKPSRRLYFPFLLALLCFSACRHNATGPETAPLIPHVLNAAIQPNPNNALSIIVTVRTRAATEVAIAFGAGATPQESTPRFEIVHDSARVSVLGLRADTEYALQAIAYSASGERSTGMQLSFKTPPLPHDLPRLSVQTRSSPTVKYVLLGIAPSGQSDKTYAVIVEASGSIVWYKKFHGAVVDFQKQPHGNYTAFSSLRNEPSHFYEMNQLGEVVREFRASNGLETGPHELRIFDDGYCLFGIEHRTMDLRAIGGLPNAVVRGLVVEYHRGAAAPLLWNTFEHMQIADAASDIALDAAAINPWHGNAIERDRDGNLLVSFRNSDEIVKINAQTGALMWRLGGKNNHFTFRNDRDNGFSHQHGIRRLQNGNIILFDNGNLHAPQQSRAAEYRLDETAKIAELAWEYRHEPHLYFCAGICAATCERKHSHLLRHCATHY